MSKQSEVERHSKAEAGAWLAGLAIGGLAGISAGMVAMFALVQSGVVKVCGG